MSTPSRREGFLIEPYKQLRFGIMFIATNLLFSGLILAVFGYFVTQMYQAQASYFQLDSQQSQEILTKLQQPVIIGAVLVGLFIITTLFLSARYTHQFYGPLVSIRRFLDELRDGGEPHPIRLRSSDQLQDLAERLNSLRSRVGISSSSRDVEAFLDDVIAGKDPKSLALAPDHPLRGVADRLNRLDLTKSGRSN